ncbi:MAG: NAD(P)/FAD-dependent oxidoreductase [Armatimonadetes bacterium]|nr:NAD(P)/FAD-dependent oxidoreductase [Armatimonadota bacterium]
MTCVVIGAGVAGLAAAATLAQAGAGVAVFEQATSSGGLARYGADRPEFQAGAHLLPAGALRRCLVALGLKDRVPLVPLDPGYAVVFPDRRYPVRGPEALRQELSALWPVESPGLERFFQAVTTPGTDPSAPMGGALAGTLQHWLGGFTGDPELQAALSALWVTCGLPPGRLSAAHYLERWRALHEERPVALSGGTAALIAALEQAVEAAGGTIRRNLPVERILRHGGEVFGVRLADGTELQARAVISTANPQDTFEELLSLPDQPAAGYPPLRAGFVTALSALHVHLQISGDLTLPARTTLLYSSYDSGEAYRDLQRSEPQFQAMLCTAWEPWEAAAPGPEGTRLLSLFAPIPYSRYDDWEAPLELRRGEGYREVAAYRDLRDRLADRLVEQAAVLIPGLPEKVVDRLVETPLTLERLTWNTGGSAYGWAPIPEQADAFAPGVETTFRGLWLAGHWTAPGGSLAGALASGIQAARCALEPVPPREPGPTAGTSFRTSPSRGRSRR